MDEPGRRGGELTCPACGALVDSHTPERWAACMAVRRHCLPGCNRLDAHDGRDDGACMHSGRVLVSPAAVFATDVRSVTLGQATLIRTTWAGGGATWKLRMPCGDDPHCATCECGPAHEFDVPATQIEDLVRVFGL